MESLLDQEFKDFEVLVVDQNLDDRIVSVLERYQSKLNISRIATPARHGVSSGRNDGWRQARGECIVFPDDDCWYPRWFLRKGLELLDQTGAELISGRSANEKGDTINGRFSRRARRITRQSVWTTQAEWVTFYRRGLLEHLGGFDEELGIGSEVPWQAAEGPDLILKAVHNGCFCYYDPALYGFHQEYDLDDPTGAMEMKGRMYGRGMGYVLRRHECGTLAFIHWASRPLATVLLSIVTGRFHRAAYSLSVSLGRTEGFLGYLWPIDQRYRATDGTWTPPAGTCTADASISFGKKLREMTGPYWARDPLLIATLYATDGIASLLPKRRQEISGGRPLRVLVANWGHLGDAVALLPLLKYLENHPRVQDLGVLIGSWSRPILEASNIAARIHTCDHWSLDRSNKSMRSKLTNYLRQRKFIVAELKRCRYDMSIDSFATFPSSHDITWSASIPCRVGFKSSGLGQLLTEPIDWMPDDRFMLDHQLELLKPLLGESRPPSLSASYPGFDTRAAEVWCNADLKPYVVIHMGPPNLRRWVLEKWISLAARIRSQGYNLIITGGPGREMEAARVLSAKVPVRDLTGRQSWEQFVATIANAAAIVSVDSVAGHVAACFNVPAVILAAGRQRLNLWKPNSSHAIMVTHPVGCAPCNRAHGCRTMACVRLIEVAEVFSSLQKVIELRPSAPLQVATVGS
jgi:ADP-heptose:LPS heptosyltransferase/glycosyltransferase involved in cell wall biosynthesis